MIPKGLFGIASKFPLRTDDWTMYVHKYMSDDEDFLSTTSQDKRCVLGVVKSTLYKYPAAVSSDKRTGSVGAIDGLFYSETIIDRLPHLLLDTDRRLYSELNGMFCCAAYKPSMLKLFSDPFGTSPLYYRFIQDAVVFSSSLKLLIELPEIPGPSLSELGFAQLLSFHTVLDSYTIFEGIYKLRSAEVLTVDLLNGSHTTQRYWVPVIDNSGNDNSISKCVESFRQAVERTVQRVPKPIAVGLSGGFDSRTIWSVLSTMNEPVLAVTHGMTMGHDVMLAMKVAKSLGLQHHIHWIDDSFKKEFESFHSELVETTNSQIGADNSHLVFVYKKHHGLSQTIIDGNHSNLEWRLALRNTSKRIRNQLEFKEAFWRQMYRPGLLSLLNPDTVQLIIETARHALFTILPDYRQYDSPGCAADAFNISYLLSNHYTDAVCLQNHYNRYYSPYFDLDYVNELARVPEIYRWKQATQYAVVKAYSPSVLRIPRAYSDIKTFATSNPFILRIPVAWSRFVLPRLDFYLPDSVIKLLDPRKPSMNYRNILTHYAVNSSQLNINNMISSRFDQSRYHRLVDMDIASIALLLTIESSSSLYNNLNIH